MSNIYKSLALVAVPVLAATFFVSGSSLSTSSLGQDLAIAAATATESTDIADADVATLDDWSYTFGGFRSYNFFNFGNYNAFGFRPRRFGFGGFGGPAYGGYGSSPGWAAPAPTPAPAPANVSLNLPSSGAIDTASIANQLQPIFSGSLGSLLGGGSSYYNPTPYYPQPVQIVINIVVNIVQPQPEPPAQSPFCA